MRKLIKLEKISTNRKNIQKKWNKKWLTRGIFTCVAAIALIGSYRYISGIVKVSSNVNGKELPIYCVQTDERRLRSHLMRHGGMMIPRESWTF